MISVPSSSIVRMTASCEQVAELHVADELVDAELLVVEHLLEALLGVADDDHVGLVELARVEVALELALQQREDLVLLLLA